MMDPERLLEEADKDRDETFLRLGEELYPICRSITGDGVRATLEILKRRVPLQTIEVPTDTRVFDWTVPKEWNIRDGYILDGEGRKIVDFKRSNLHVLNYSTPVDETMSLAELKPHLYSLPENPDVIPYKTSYYKKAWGFCLSYNQMRQLREGEYRVRIDSTLEDGFLTYGEYYKRGRVEDEVLFSTHVCHPSMCNDNLSGIQVAALLAELLCRQDLKYSYRFLFVPGTIGSITWLARNEDRTGKIKHGVVISGVGDRGSFTFKKSRKGDAPIDRIVPLVLKQHGEPFTVREFSPYGYDERQFCSPGFDLPVGNLSRTPHGTYPEYHTSADNMEFVRKESLSSTLKLLARVVHAIETDGYYLNRNPKCEPQLGKRGLYDALGGRGDARHREMAMLWILSYSDGGHSLSEISALSGIDMPTIAETARILERHQLLERLAKGEAEAPEGCEPRSPARNDPGDAAGS